MAPKSSVQTRFMTSSSNFPVFRDSKISQLHFIAHYPHMGCFLGGRIWKNCWFFCLQKNQEINEFFEPDKIFQDLTSQTEQQLVNEIYFIVFIIFVVSKIPTKTNQQFIFHQKRLQICTHLTTPMWEENLANYDQQKLKAFLSRLQITYSIQKMAFLTISNHN